MPRYRIAKTSMNTGRVVKVLRDYGRSRYDWMGIHRNLMRDDLQYLREKYQTDRTSIVVQVQYDNGRWEKFMVEGE